MPDRELGPPAAESTPPSGEPPFCGSAFLRGPLHGPGAAAFEAHHAGGHDKPPRGAMPDWVWRTKRATELADAILAYLGRSSRIDLDCIAAWSTELAEHAVWLRTRKVEPGWRPEADYLRREKPSPDSGVTFAPIRVDLPPPSKTEQATFEAIRSMMTSDPIAPILVGEANRRALAECIVNRLFADIRERRGLGQAVQRSAWAQIICEELSAERIVREELARG